MKVGLRARVAIAFALLSFIVAATVAGSTYAFARWYLLDQRESAALTRAVLDARAVDAALQGGSSPAGALAEIPTVGTSQQLIRVGGTWYTGSVSVPPDALPERLLALAATSGARQRLDLGSEPYLVVAIPIVAAMYVEVFPLRDLDRTLMAGGWALVAMTALATIAGAAIGATTAGRVLVPLRRLASGATRVAGGELSTRIPLTADADLDPIAESFNEMAEAVQQRIARERRFTANVSHELRSPLTAIVGTAELLEEHRSQLPARDAALASVLAGKARRLSQMLLDLLEISRFDNDDPPQWETADIAALCREVVMMRGGRSASVVGDQPMVRTDSRRLERIVGNLVDNAERHGGGLVRLTIQREPDSVLLIFDDGGPGIRDDERERLFEPFARGHGATSSDGAGLGLAIVGEQAAVLGGTVTAQDAPGGGARFVVSLPVRQEEA